MPLLQVGYGSGKKSPDPAPHHWSHLDEKGSKGHLFTVSTMRFSSYTRLRKRNIFIVNCLIKCVAVNIGKTCPVLNLYDPTQHNFSIVEFHFTLLGLLRGDHRIFSSSKLSIFVLICFCQKCFYRFL